MRSQLQEAARQLVEDLRLDELSGSALAPERFKYEYVYQYPPPLCLKDMDESTVFPGTSTEPKEAILYLHIPYCTGDCLFCFYVRVKPSDQRLPRSTYADYLRREINLMANRLPSTRFTSGLIGGGTPTCLERGQLGSVLSDIRERFTFSTSMELTCETAPETVSEEIYRDLRESGVSRVSLGVQAFQDRLLKTLRRRHDSADAVAAYWAARTAGFDCVNVDLIYGLPDQTLHDWEETLARTLELAPETICAYHMRAHPEHPLTSELDMGRIPSENDMNIMYAMAIIALGERGYQRNSSNKFARSTETQHRMVSEKRGRNAELIGFGIGAYYYVNDTVVYNHYNPELYARSVDGGKLPVFRGRRLDRPEQQARMLILSLKTGPGLQRSIYNNTFNEDVLDTFPWGIQRLTDMGLIEVDSESVQLTLRGLFVADEVMKSLFLPYDTKRAALLAKEQSGIYYTQRFADYQTF